MERVGKIQDGDMYIKGELEENLPVVTSGLIAHFPFNNSYGKIRSFKGIKVLFAKTINQYSPISSYLSTNGATIVEVATLETVDVTTAKQYDLIVADFAIWGVPQATINKLKEFVDAGISCLAQGNDTRENYFVKTYDTVAGQATHSILIDEDCPFELTTNVYDGSGDLIGGIVELQNNAVPLYRRFDKNLITGWYYQSPTSGAVLFFDLEGNDTYEPVVKGAQFALANSKGGLNIGDVVLSNDGLYAQNSTTNIWSGPLYIYNNFSQPASLITTGETYLGQPVYRLAFTVTDPNVLSSFQNDLDSHGVYGGTMTFKASTKYAISIYWRAVNKPDTVVGGVASNIAGFYVGANEKLDNGWNRYTRFRDGNNTNALTDAIHHSFRTPSARLNETIYIDFACPQTEEGKDYATAYTPSTRGSNSNFEINNLNLQNYSLAFKFKPTNEYYKGETGLVGSYNKIMLKMVDSSGSKEIRYSDYSPNSGPEITTANPFFDLEPNASWNNTQFHYHHYTAYKKNKWHDFVITKSGNAIKIYIQLDGTVLANVTYNNDLLTGFTLGKLMLGWPNIDVWNGVFKDLSIYDRALTDGEINKIVKSTLNISPAGNLNTNDVIERPQLVKDTLYFPLGVDGKSEHGVISPKTATSITYKDGAAWIGRAYTNLFTHSGNGAFPVTSGKNFIVEKNTNDEVIYRYDFAGELWNYKGVDIAVTSGETYTVSFEAFVSKNFNGTNTVIANVEQTGGKSFEYDMSKKGTWQKFTHIFTADANGNSRLLMYPAANNATGTQGYILYKNFQMIANGFDFPFVKGTRPYQSLTYNATDLGTANFQNFAMLYTVKHIYTGTYRISGAWPRFYFGVQMNDTVIFSWTENGTQRSVGTGVAIPLNKWVTIGVSVSNNAFIDLYINGEKVTSFTSPFQLNGVDNGVLELNSIADSSTSYPLNGWLKDFMFVPRALSPEEMSLLSKKQMSTNDKELRLRGQLFENQEL